jgi:hypothetical protein
MMLLDCPAYLDRDGTAQCGLPAEIRSRFTMRSTGGPLESAMIRCPAGHWFNGPIESLIRESADKHDPGTAQSLPPPGAPASHAAMMAMPALAGPSSSPRRAGQAIRRPNTAPAYYLGRPASLWITAMSPRRRDTASTHLIQAITGG